MRDKTGPLGSNLFVVGRLMKALGGDEPGRESGRARHATLAWIGGPVIAVAAAIAVLVVGYVQAPAAATSPWRQEGTLLVEQETGSLYVFLHGRLHPASDEASARLAAAAAVPVPGPPVTVATADLAGAPRGTVISVPGAPHALPPASAMAGSLALCTGQGAGGVAVIAPVPAQGAVDDDQGVLIGKDGKTFLLWHGRRYELADDVAKRALGAQGVSAVPVGAELLDLLPQGQSLHVTGIPQAGTPAFALDGKKLRNGQVATASDPATGRSTFYLVLYDQLLPVSETEAALALNDPANTASYAGGAVTPVVLDPATVAAAPKSGAGSVTGDWPPSPPKLVNTPSGTDQVCLRLDPGIGPASIGGATGGTVAPSPSASASPTPPPAAGSIHALLITAGQPPLPQAGSAAPQLPPGGGVLIRSGAGSAQGPLWLLADDGRLHRVVDDLARAALGYRSTPAIPVPDTVIGMLPSGAELSTAAAVTPS
jgi:type VII secretion protein EccB